MLTPARTVPRRDGAAREGRATHLLRVAVLCSRRAPALPYLLTAPGRGHRWQLVALVTSEPESPALEGLVAAGIPTLVHDIRAFYGERGTRIRNLALRSAYDQATVDLLRPYRPDLLVLCGYLHIATATLLEAYPSRVINVHDADFTVTGPDGRPKYRGLRSTRDAIFAGAHETRSTVHLATAEVDVGPALVRSWAFSTHALVHEAIQCGATDILKAYAYAQREWMMRAAWGPLVERALERFARDEVRFLDGRAFLCGTLGPEELTAPSPQPVQELERCNTSV